VYPPARVGQGHRNHGAPAPGSHPRTSASRTCEIPTSRPGDPCSIEPFTPPIALAVLPGHPRDPAALAPRSCKTQVASLEKATTAWAIDVGSDLVDLIVRLGKENRSWGCVRIHGELRKLGIRISATSIRRVLRRHRLGPPPRGGPSWSEFLRAQAAASWPLTFSPSIPSFSSGSTCSS
jgi:hypothetical protein